MTSTINPDIKVRILQAANELVIEGIKEPTNAQVLQKMGRGSLSHVSPVMREWRAEQKKEALKQYDIPEELEHLMQVSLRQLWKCSTALSRAELTSFKQRVDEQLLECEAERDEALLEIKKLEDQIRLLQSILAERDKECEHLIKEKKGLEDSYHAERTKNIVLEETVKTQQENINRLQDELIAIAKHRAS